MTLSYPPADFDRGGLCWIEFGADGPIKGAREADGRSLEVLLASDNAVTICGNKRLLDGCHVSGVRPPPV